MTHQACTLNSRFQLLTCSKSALNPTRLHLLSVPTSTITPKEVVEQDSNPLLQFLDNQWQIKTRINNNILSRSIRLTSINRDLIRFNRTINIRLYRLYQILRGHPTTNHSPTCNKTSSIRAKKKAVTRREIRYLKLICLTKETPLTVQLYNMQMTKL